MGGRVFHLQIALSFGPAVIALALHGTAYYIAMSVFSAIFLLALMQISANLHRIFMQALVAREREAALAGQFDTALNNMPHGLCMFSVDGQLAVMNHRFREMMNLSDEFVQSGASAPAIIAACVSAGSIPEASGRMIPAEIEHTRARDMITNDRPDEARTARCRGYSSQWPMAARWCCSRTSPSGATRSEKDQPSGALRRAHRAAEPSQFPRRSVGCSPAIRCDAATALAVRRSRPVQASQRHARPSVR